MSLEQPVDPNENIEAVLKHIQSGRTPDEAVYYLANTPEQDNVEMFETLFDKKILDLQDKIDKLEEYISLKNQQTEFKKSIEEKKNYAPHEDHEGNPSIQEGEQILKKYKETIINFSKLSGIPQKELENAKVVLEEAEESLQALKKVKENASQQSSYFGENTN